MKNDCFDKNKSVHTSSECVLKKLAVAEATGLFVKDFMEGKMENPEFLFHRIESLAELVKEAKRG